MPGAGTDKTKRWIERPAPIVVLVEPQMGENVGAAARAMANFGLSRLRLVKPVQGWPNERARVMAAGAGSQYQHVGLHYMHMPGQARHQVERPGPFRAVLVAVDVERDALATQDGAHQV